MTRLLLIAAALGAVILALLGAVSLATSDTDDDDQPGTIPPVTAAPYPAR